MAYNVRGLAAGIIRDADSHNDFAAERLKKTLAEIEVSRKDRALLLELVNGTYRWRGKIDWILDRFCQKGLHSCPPPVQTILETAIYQLMFHDRIPQYAVLHEAVELCKQSVNVTWSRVVNAVLRTYLRERDSIKWPSLDEDPARAISVLYSHPSWLVGRWLRRYGTEKTIALCSANNKTPDISLRINRLAGARGEILEEIGALVEYVVSPFEKNFISISAGSDITEFAPLRRGHCSVQDPSAGLAVRLLDPHPGEVIVEIGAAPGGKSGYIAERSRNEAVIVSVDINKRRLRRVAENRLRLAATSLRPVVADGVRPPLRCADRVLVDVPCSGLGVLAKRADLRWRRTELDLANLVKLQKVLLTRAADLVTPGGVLVYSTCTIEPQENEEIVEDFLQHHERYELQRADRFLPQELTDDRGYAKTFPHIHGMDGSFSARMFRTR